MGGGAPLDVGEDGGAGAAEVGHLELGRGDGGEGEEGEEGELHGWRVAC